jgi:glucose-1-phosphate adenylyltransferase
MNARSTPPRTQTFILAGGQGKRLFPLTVSRPKPAVSFGGVFRIIDFTLSNCLHSGLERVSVLTQYRHEELHACIGRGWSDLWRDRDRDPPVCLPPTGGKRYRGTADAVFNNLQVMESEKLEFVLILSGDHVYHMDYRDLLLRHAETNADLTIATVEHPVKDASHFGVVEVDADFRVTGFAEKPIEPRPLPSTPAMALISMGVYVFRKELLVKTLIDSCETGMGHDFGRDIIPSLIRSARVCAYDFRDEVQDLPRYWRDIGTLDSYYDASMDLVDDIPRFDPHAKDIGPLRPTSHPVRDTADRLLAPRVNTDSRVTQSVLSPDVQIEGGTEIEGSVLMPGVRVGKNARIRRAIIEEGIEIPEGFHIGLDLDHDRGRYTVTESGVVVVGKTMNEAQLKLVAAGGSR